MMFSIDVIRADRELPTGIKALVHTAAQHYGPAKELPGSMGELLHGSSYSGEQEAARQQLCELMHTHADGVRTALLIAGGLLCKSCTCDSPGGVALAVEEALQHTRRAANGLGGLLPGGGLWLLGLNRPLRQLARQHEPEAASILGVAAALRIPFSCLVQGSGGDLLDIYAQVKAAMPTQFYSLHHFGLSGSIPPEKKIADCPRFGYDVVAHRVRDLVEAGITTPLETAEGTLMLAEAIYRTALTPAQTSI